MWAVDADEVLLPLRRRWKKDMEREWQMVNKRLDAARLQVRPLVSIGQVCQ